MPVRLRNIEPVVFLHSVGIGVESPSTKLDISGPTSTPVRFVAANSQPGYLYSDSAGAGLTSASNSSAYGFYINSIKSELQLRTNSIARVFVDSNGFVGIGTASPSEKLDVSGTVKASAIQSGGITDSSKTSGRVLFAGTGGVHSESSNLTFTGSNLLSVTGTVNATIGSFGSVTSTGLITSGGHLSAPSISSSGAIIGTTITSGTAITGTTITGTTINGTTITGTNIIASNASVSGTFSCLTFSSAAVVFSAITDPSKTQGSILFAGAGGAHSQNNANLFWDNTNSRLGIGTKTPGWAIEVGADAKISGLIIGKGGGAKPENTVIGSSALSVNTDGTHNTALGYEPLYANTTGHFNSAFGSRTLYDNISGNYNSAFGYFSLFNNETGYNNTAFGASSLYLNIGGANNTSVGFEALYSTSGNSNTAIGYGSGKLISTGSKNSIFGPFSGNNSPPGTQSGFDIRTLNNYVVLADGDGVPKLIINSSGKAGIAVTSLAELASLSGGLDISGDKLQVAGIIHTSVGGVRFPDGTVQISATATGSKGEKGDQGLAGTPGGPKGDPGPQGPAGPQTLPGGTVGLIQFHNTSTVFAGASSLFYDNTNSKLGVGLFSASSLPLHRLDVKGDVNIDQSSFYRLADSKIISLSSGIVTYSDINSAGIKMETNGITRLTIHPGGFVAIGPGSTTPEEKLTVVGNVKATIGKFGSVESTGAISSASITSSGTITGNHLSASSISSSGTITGASITSPGFVTAVLGITDSSKTLGSVLFVGESGAHSQNKANLFWDNVNNRLGISLGDSSPQHPLEVAGTVKATAGLFGTVTSTGAISSASIISSGAIIGANITSPGVVAGGGITDSTKTPGRVLFAGTNGVHSESPNLTFANSSSVLSVGGAVNAAAGSFVLGINDYSKTLGSVLFVGDSGAHSQHNDLFWDNVNGRLGIGTKIPRQQLEVAKNLIVGSGLTISSEEQSYNGIVVIKQLRLTSNSTGAFPPGGYAKIVIQDQLVSGVASSASGSQMLVGLNFIQVNSVNQSGVSVPSNLLLNLDGGNVGIGMTSAPAKKLDVHGDIRLGDGGSGFINFNCIDGYRGGFLVNGTERMSILSSSGNVGIGTTSPGTKLQIGTAFGTPLAGLLVGAYGVQTNGVLVDVANNSTGKGLYLGYTDAGGTVGTRGTGQDIRFNADVVAMTILAAGNVGIGTTSPEYKLHVVPNIADYGFVLQNLHASSYGAYIRGGKVDGTTTALDVVNTAGTALMSVLGSGNVGIGTTSPLRSLHIQGSSVVVSVKARATLVIDDTAAFATGVGGAITFRGKYNTAGDYVAAGYIQAHKLNATAGNESFDLALGTRSLGSGAAEVMRLTSTGYVGIGTTIPSKKLNVVGVDQSSATIRIGTNDENLIALDITGNGASGHSYIDSVTNDASYKMYFRMRTGGTPIDAMIIGGSGNVGIGTTSPATLLHVDTTGADARIRVSAGSNSTQGGMIANSGTGLIYAGSISNHGFSLRTNDIDRVRIDTNGNVGIGTTAPSSNAIARFLHLNDATSAGIVLQGVRKFSVYSSSSSSLVIQDESSGATRFVVDSNGLVGIGTTGPSSLLHVKHPTGNLVTRFEGLSNSYASKVYISSTSSGDGGIYYDGNTNLMDVFSYGDMRFDVGTANISGTIGNERMVIKQGGFVGIGTASPSEKLDVSGTVKASAIQSGGITDSSKTSGRVLFAGTGGVHSESSNLTFTGNNLLTVGGALNVTGITDFSKTPGSVLFVGTTGVHSQNNAKLFWDNANSRLGIGTASPAVKLDIQGADAIDSIYIRRTGGSVITHKIGNDVGGSGAIQLYDQVGVEKNRINSTAGSPSFFNAGDVGIGTAGPSAKLDVIGTVKASAIQSGSITDSSKTSGRVLFAGASGVHSESPNLTFASSTNVLTVTGTVKATILEAGSLTIGGSTITSLISNVTASPSSVSGQDNTATSYFSLPRSSTSSTTGFSNGYLRYNTETSTVEVFSEGQWVRMPGYLLANVLVVGGGGGGGRNGKFQNQLASVKNPDGTANTLYSTNGGGGGGGGVVEVFNTLIIKGCAYQVLVGAGGNKSYSGSHSSFNSIVALGGGFGGSLIKNSMASDGSLLMTAPGGGGSGGGGAGHAYSFAYLNFSTGGEGTLGQGNNGGSGSASTTAQGGGGGGGAGGVGGSVGGAGGSGKIISGVTYGAGGVGGSGSGSNTLMPDADGAANTGNGGPCTEGNRVFGKGGSGIVIVTVIGGLTYSFKASTVKTF